MLSLYFHLVIVLIQNTDSMLGTVDRVIGTPGLVCSSPKCSQVHGKVWPVMGRGESIIKMGGKDAYGYFNLELTF